MKVKEYQLVNGRTLEIHTDETAESPRMWTNNGIMSCWHPRYNLGDPEARVRMKDFDSPLGVRRRIEGENEVIAILPLYAYDHSGITISTDKRDVWCPWDSGQVGWIYATRESLASCGHDVDSLEVAQVEEWLRDEVKTYDQYLRGDVYGFAVRKPNCKHCGAKGEYEDSCWGFYGDDPTENGMIEHFSEEDREAIKACHSYFKSLSKAQ